MDPTTLHLLSAGAAGVAAALGLVTWARLRRAPAVGAGATGALDDDGGDDAPAAWRRAVAPLALHLRPTSAEELDLLGARLLNAGLRSRDAVDRFCEDRVVAMLAGMLGALVWAAVVGGGAGALLAMVSLVLGLVGPGKVLAARAAERQEAIRAALPGAIDLLTTCVDAGLSLEHALARVARELDAAAPVLAEELAVTARELQAGVTLPDGLRRLSRRVGLDELSALCGVIAQAHGLGAPVGNTLREFAESSRRSRMSMLEERAGKLAAQLTVPLATCLLPAAMLIIIGPAVLQLVRALH
jgi:tight adherence protein C